MPKFVLPQCTAQTKDGRRCLLEQNAASDFCHIHDPACQCGVVKTNGKTCTIPTGGAVCIYHNGSYRKNNPSWRATARKKSRRRSEIQQIIDSH